MRDPFEINDIHDAVSQAWQNHHEDASGDHWPCKLCGATMYANMDYTHKRTCPFVVLEKAIDAFAEALENLEQT